MKETWPQAVWSSAVVGDVLGGLARANVVT
jgi:hypothetical protein